MAKEKDRSVLGSTVTSSDPAIQAYLDAKASSSGRRDNWDIVGDVFSDISSGIQQGQAQIELEKENKRKELEAYEDQFRKNAEKILLNVGGLGEEAYGLATEQAKALQEEYMNAVKNDDKETQTTLKMKLQGLATSCQALKENLSIAAELKKDKSLSNGRTALEKEISAACTNQANLVHHEGEFKWRNPNYDPETEGSKQFFTQEDLDGSLVLKDEKTSKAFIDFEYSQNESGQKYVDGAQGAGDFHEGRMKTKIADEFITEENIMSVMHDDFRKTGESHTFSADLGGYLDSMGDNLYKGLGIDVNKDGFVNEDDWDSDEDKKVIIDAVTNKESEYYKFEVSKDIVAGWLTMHAKNKFYGSSDPNLQPEDNETLDAFKLRGGIIGRWINNPDSGYTFDSETKTFIKKLDQEADLAELGY